ncbi:hypothetical protein [Georgenia sp. SUBG003]|uniref:hypothetical protein n=1 Tax=Georgenia sp. SUBG003 TaxID=1497974 RepID=UPI003AB75854
MGGPRPDGLDDGRLLYAILVDKARFEKIAKSLLFLPSTRGTPWTSPHRPPRRPS